MRMPRPTLTLAFTLLAVAATATDARAEFVLFKNIWGDVIVSTDTTPEGRKLAPPTPQRPVYYKGQSLGRRLGSIPGNLEPDVPQLNLFVGQVLAKHGYLAAPAGMAEPELFLVLQWGYLKPGGGDLRWFLGYNPEQDIAAPSHPTMLGGEVFRRGFRSRLIDTILENSQAPIYGIIVTAFDFKTARTAAPIAYWQTRIGLPANGKSMAAALPVMITAAGPAIGRPAAAPVLVSADHAREGQVNLGDLKFLGFEENPAQAPQPARPEQ